MVQNDAKLHAVVTVQHEQLANLSALPEAAISAIEAGASGSDDGARRAIRDGFPARAPDAAANRFSMSS